MERLGGWVGSRERSSFRGAAWKGWGLGPCEAWERLGVGSVRGMGKAGGWVRAGQGKDWGLGPCGPWVERRMVTVGLGHAGAR